MKYDVIVVGGGISGLTAGALLSKRGLKTAVIDKNYAPGGSCGIFKRDGIIFDQGSAMLFGFGEKGFNSHRFVFNCLEEPIDIIKHDLLYCVNFKNHRIKFYNDIELFTEELSNVFPSEKDNIKRFYKDMYKMYKHVIVDSPNYTTPDQTDPVKGLKSLLKHPLSYIKFLGYLNKSAKKLLEKYFTDPEIFNFFDKLTSTYCYATVEESPAVLAAVMFVDNHVGGSYYPAGSTVFLPGKLEKVIEENNGDMIMNSEVTEIIINKNKACGVKLSDNSILSCDNIIYSGTVWNLYNKLIKNASDKKISWANRQIPTYPSVVLYSYVDKKVIPENTQPVEMLVGDPDKLDESEVTAYIFSIDDKTLCPDDYQTVIAIGPSFKNWDNNYKDLKKSETERLLNILEKRFPGFKSAVKYSEIATPLSLEKYTSKNGGAVAGPKQMLGQHMFKRLHTKTEWKNIYCCGESTVMGTGTPTVTVSGLSAANAVLKKYGKKEFVFENNMKNYVNILEKPVKYENLYSSQDEETKEIIKKASKCQFCENHYCSGKSGLDIRSIMRKITVENFYGAKKIIDNYSENIGSEEDFGLYEERCIMNRKYNTPVEINEIINYMRRKSFE